MRIVWTRRASAEFVDAVARSAEFGPAAQERLIGMVDRALVQMAAHPLSARQGRIDGTRELVLKRAPYILVYRLTPASLTVLAFRNTARDTGETL